MSGFGSKCGTDGHATSAFPPESSSSSAPAGEIMIFGVRVKVDPMRKSVSMNNLSQYEHRHEAAADNPAPSFDSLPAGYVSADEAPSRQSSGVRERKRGVPWTEEEHKLFLLGLQKVGKGDWRGISRNFVKTRTPTQVASHAQKYFIRRNNLSRRRRRSSLFDITTDSVTAIPMEEEPDCQNNTNQSVQTPQHLVATQHSQSEEANAEGFPVANFTMAVCPILLPVHVENSIGNFTIGQSDQVANTSTVLFHSIPVLPVHNASSTAIDLSSNQESPTGSSSLSLDLSLSFAPCQPSSKHTAFQVASSFNNWDGVISVS